MVTIRICKLLKQNLFTPLVELKSGCMVNDFTPRKMASGSEARIADEANLGDCRVLRETRV